VAIDLATEPLGVSKDGKPVFLKDIWPTHAEVQATKAQCIDASQFREQYANVFTGNPTWNKVAVSKSELYPWNDKSTYIQNPPYFEGMSATPTPPKAIKGARCLVHVADSVTTDHISPAGAIKKSSPAGRFLLESGVAFEDFNSYGSRRGNDRIMTRGTFANVRIKNLMVPGVEGGVTKYFAKGAKDGEQMAIFDAAEKYKADGTPLVVLAGQEYGTGSSRDWAAKGTMLLGVKAVVAQSYERIHRSNLVGMGVLPLQFEEGTSAQTLGLDGSETFDVLGLSDEVKPRQKLTLRIAKADGKTQEVPVVLRIDTPIEVEYYRHGGILPFVLRELMAAA
jgi:aconitate hydratase